MDKTKLITIILIAIILILSFYTVFSGSKRQKEIKRLTKELEIQADSLRRIQNNYETIYKEYDRIYNQLDSTRDRFTSFYHQVDSISHSTISSIYVLKGKLNTIISGNKPLTGLDTTRIPHIFF
jgi:predicted PurR-regulated permease PerM